ncbi:hypothetical protein ABK040_004446 [Willaertia magna]
MFSGRNFAWKKSLILLAIISIFLVLFIIHESSYVNAQRRRRRNIPPPPTTYDDEEEKPRRKRNKRKQAAIEEDEEESDNDNNNDGSIRTVMEKHSFQPPFLFGGQNSIPHWEYGGSTIATEKYIRIVPAIKSRTGYIWNTEPLQTKHWEVEFDFHIHHTHSPGADGMAFFYAREPMKTGSLLGYSDQLDGLGILLDTYDNNLDGDNPAVIAIKGNGRRVDYDIDNDFRANQLDRCRADIRNPIGGKTTIRVRYFKKTLTVTLDTTASGHFAKCFEINNLDLPAGYYFGLTAATGGLADNHDVLSFISYDLDPSHQNKEEEVHRDAKNRGWYDPYEEFKEYLEKQNNEQQNNNEENNNHEEQQHHEDNLREQIETELKNKKENKEQVDEEERKFFEQLKEKMKHPSDEEKPNKQNQPQQQQNTQQPAVQERDGTITFNSQTGLLILEALEEVAKSVKKSSTKNDIINILEFVNEVSKKQEQVQQQFQHFSDNVKRDVNQMLDDLKRDTEALNVQLRRLDSLLTNVYNDVGEIQKTHGDIRQGISQQSQTIGEIQKSSGSGVGTWLIVFILFQVAFAAGFIYYKKYQETKSKFY